MPRLNQLDQLRLVVDRDPGKAAEALSTLVAAGQLRKASARVQACILLARALAKQHKWMDSAWALLPEALRGASLQRLMAPFHQGLLLWALHCNFVGRIDEALHVAMGLFRDPGVRPAVRLGAARLQFWLMLHVFDSPRVQALVQEARALAASSSDAAGRLALEAVIRLGEFCLALSHAGVPTPTNPHPPARTSAAQRAESHAEIDKQFMRLAGLAGMAGPQPPDPLLLLTQGLMLAYLHGWGAAELTFGRLWRLFGHCYADWIAAFVGYAHVLSGDGEGAIRELDRAAERPPSGGDDAPALLRDFVEYRASVLRGDSQRALAALERFHAGRARRRARLLADLAHLAVPPHPGKGSGAMSGAAPQGAGCVARVQTYIHAHLSHPITVSDLVVASSVSRRTLETTLRRTLSTSPLELLRSIRLTEANRLLTHTDGTVGQVRAAVGYRSASSFSRDYRKAFGFPPRERGGRGASSPRSGFEQAPQSQV